MSAATRERIESAFGVVVGRLVREMKPEGFWEGELSSSALSTATAISALCVARKPGDRAIVERGVSWLRQTVNPDAGWGDTPDSPSNLATTLLVKAALRLSDPSDLSDQSDSSEAEIVAAINDFYGADRTFAVPILANCALAGMVSWNCVPGLPFELAVFPRAWYRLLRLDVVSYALPALIAVGLAIHHHAPSRSPFRRLARRAAIKTVLEKLRRIQPENGGFLEATPLTSFTAMTLGSVYGADQPVVSKCLEFIRQSQRPDGSWPIDTNLSVWITTGAISALTNADRLDEIDVEKTSGWLAARQYKSVHPFTGAAPGGFAWTHLPGGVPDADDTSGAVLASIHLGNTESAGAAVDWLLGLQNADGGWPAFCRGWGQLPFDRSSPDITAHAIRALRAFDSETDAKCRRAVERGYDYLAAAQQADGSWIPLWFGNQAAEDHSNRVFGTSRSLLAYAGRDSREVVAALQYLLQAQNDDGGWGGGQGIASSVEESSLAVTALIRFGSEAEVQSATTRGIDYLVSRVEDSSWTTAAPIGLYFSSLWYSERLYPIAWAVEALGLAACGGSTRATEHYVCNAKS